MKLSDIFDQRTYRITAIGSPLRNSLSRLHAMGVKPQASIKLLHRAPLGDPLQVQVGFGLISMRAVDAMAIEVELVD